MPLIKSKKYGNEQYVDVETWKKFQETGRAAHFKVIDDGDIHDTIQTPSTFVPIPREDVDNSVEKSDEMSRAELKTWLTEHNIEFNVRSSTEKLYSLFKTNQ